MTEKLIIDRFEGDYAVCETPNRDQQLIERTRLPADAKEGDCLTVADSCITIDAEETARRRAAAQELLKALLKR